MSSKNFLLDDAPSAITAFMWTFLISQIVTASQNIEASWYAGVVVVGHQDR
uniref:Uncharacterized protein n=1 Tax=Ciona intestinalis TaxID=7719 RepID=H2XKD6_CIOIN